jgi:putative acetyltransferase
MIEPPEPQKTHDFQMKLITSGAPVFYAVDGERVVGWADVSAAANPRLAHRGFLGMGLVRSHRGQGLGPKLLDAALARAKTFGLEKVELSVYTENQPAIRLYQKAGFEQEGLIRHYRKLDGVYFDCFAMGKFL